MGGWALELLAYLSGQTGINQVLMRAAWWDNVKVVEFLDVGGSLAVNQSHSSVFSVDFCQLGVVDNIDSSLLALGFEEFINIVLMLAESVIGVDDSEGGSWTHFSQSLKSLPGLVSGEEAVGSDLTLEWEFRDVEVGVSVVEVTSPTSEFEVENSPVWVVSAGVNWSVEIFPGGFESLDLVNVLLKSYFILGLGFILLAVLPGFFKFGFLPFRI